MSTIVVIRGLAIIAGSIFKDLAISGKTPPITFAIIIVKNILIAKSLKIDPAIMASPLITTIVDTAALIIYFQLSVIFLHI